MHKIKKSIGFTPNIIFDFEKKEFEDTLMYDENGVCQAVPIDIFASQPFMFNDCGFPINDIMAFENAQSDSVARACLERIRVLHPDNAPAGMSPAELMRQIVPANYSTPAEYMKIQDYFARDFYARVAVASEKPVQQEKSVQQEVESKES